jgi:hypothetical protein
VSVDSMLGAGSTFTATIPVTYARATPEAPVTDAAAPFDATRLTVLLVEDSSQDLLLYYEHRRRRRADGGGSARAGWRGCVRPVPSGPTRSYWISSCRR